MSFLDRFRKDTEPRTCSACHTERPAADFAPPSLHRCVKCRRKLAPCAFIVATAHQADDNDKAARVASAKKSVYNDDYFFVRDEVPKRRKAHHYDQCNDCLAAANSITYNSSRGIRSYQLSGGADKPAPDLTDVCDQCRCICDAEETGFPSLAGRKGCGRVLPRMAFQNPALTLCADCHRGPAGPYNTSPVRRCTSCERTLLKSLFQYASENSRRERTTSEREHCNECEERRQQWTRAEAASQGQARLAAHHEHAARERREAEDARNPTTPRPDGVSLGLTTKGGAPVTITNAIRNRHLYIIGATGTGKSTLLRNLAIQDMRAGRGLAFLDPHGDIVDELTGYVPTERLDDVCYFDPTDEHAPAFNLLAMPFEPAKLTSDTVSAFKMFFGESSFGPRMEHLMRHALLTLLCDREPHSVADLRTLLVDTSYRADVVARISDDDLKSFWRVEFPSMSKDAAGPILNKIATVLVPGSALKRVFSARTNALDIVQVMNTGKILLVNLSKGQLGEEPARLLGGLITTAIAQSALARARIPEADRRDFFFYCDEFQNFAAIPSTESILSEARKYRLNLTLANQTLSQIPGDLLSTIKGNVQTFVAFNISPDDAGVMGKLMNRPRYWRKQTETRDVDLYPGDYAARYQAAQGGRPIDERTTETTATNHTRQEVDDLIRAGAVPSEFHEIEWPTVRDFTDLEPLHAFVRIQKATNVSTLFVPFPPTPADPTTRAAVLEHQRQRHNLEKTAAAGYQEKNRPRQSPQEARSPAPEAQPTHENSTTLPEAPATTIEPPPHDPTDDTDEFLT